MDHERPEDRRAPVRKRASSFGGRQLVILAALLILSFCGSYFIISISKMP